MHRLKAYELRDQFLKGDISAKEIACYFLKRAEKNDKKLNAFITILNERVLQRAELLDEKRKKGHFLGKLAAIPIAIKDNMHLEKEITSCASQSLSSYIAPFSASFIHHLENQDALLMGKTNLDELAMGSSTEFSYFGATKNPWNLECSPGGSSGGSAAAIAARSALVSLGSDTGGSIRQPASLCGVIGLKPTYGRISRYGLVPFASSLDHVGPFSTCAKDCALLCEVLFKRCPFDPTSVDQPSFDVFPFLETPLKNLVIGIPWGFVKNLPDESHLLFSKALENLKCLGAKILDIDIPELSYSVAAYHVIAPLEALTNLARIDGFHHGLLKPFLPSCEKIGYRFREEGFGMEVKKRLVLGAYIAKRPYLYEKALAVKSVLLNRFSAIFETCSLIALPSSPSTAFKLTTHKDPMQGYLQDLYTISSNLTGHPSISIPCGFSQDNLPYGLQLIAPHFRENKLLHVAHLFEAYCPPQIPPDFN